MTGSLQEKNGKYYAVINTYDINGKRKPKWFAAGLSVRGNKKNAEKFLRDKIRELELGQNIIPSDILFCDYVESWLEQAKMRLDIITYQGYKNIVDAHIVPYFKEAAIPLNKLKREHIQKYINEMHEHGRTDGKGGLSARSIKIHIVIISQTLKEALKNNLISVNPSEYVTLPKQNKREASFYNEKQLNALFEAIKDEPIYPVIYLTVLFGLRRSEVLGLKWDSIDFDNNLIAIKHTVVKYTSIVEKDSTKNASSYRTYPLFDNVKEILFKLRKKENENRKLFGNEYVENEYIFKWDNGQPYRPDFITKKFSDLLEKNGLPHIRFHDLRHSCASLLVANGFTIKDIQEWLGHADIKTTANIYAHLDVERKKNIAASMDESLHF